MTRYCKNKVMDYDDCKKIMAYVNKKMEVIE